MPNLNAFMHRRNIFRKEPDFKKLACDYHELKQFMTVGSKNKPKFDFKNPEALRALTCVLLHRYFQKHILIPPDRMIPAVPQRLNYICWVEDLIKLVEEQMSDLSVLGVDIGTGASCIFPILGCHRNPTWSFIGVEADAKSFAIANENVTKNFMEDRIRIFKVSVEDSLNDILSLATHRVTFIMCNPPFFEEEYGVTLEMNPNIGGRSKSSANTSEKIESVVNGGEITFVGRMLEQSRQLKEEVIIYTSMLGRKQSLMHFKQTFSSISDENLSWTWAELCQGKTMRYAIAWTFRPGLDLTKAPPLRHGKNKSWKVKLTRKMPKRDCQIEMLANISFIKKLVARELMIAKARVTRENAHSFEMLIKTNERTWTNQRRRRREQLNKHKHQATSSSVNFTSTNFATSSMSESLPTNSQSSNLDASIQMVCDHEPIKAKETSTATVPSDLISTNLAAHLEASDQGSSRLDYCLMHTDESPSTNQCNSNISHNISESEHQLTNSPSIFTSKKRKNPSSCSSSPSRVCPSPNDELTDDDNQSTDDTDNDEQNDDSISDLTEIKRICIKDDTENMDDIYDYILCCRISLTRVCYDIYFELKLEQPCTTASDAYDLFQYFRNKLSDK